MRLVIQRVSQARVEVEGQVCGKIEKGYLVFFGVGKEDTKEYVDKYIEKMANLRIMEDDQGKTNCSLKDVGGSVLLVSQFTLYADCKKGNRPSFTQSGDPKKAEELYEYAVEKTKTLIDHVEQGIFGADMKVSLVNDGPFTIVLDEKLMGK